MKLSLPGEEDPEQEVPLHDHQTGCPGGHCELRGCCRDGRHTNQAEPWYDCTEFGLANLSGGWFPERNL